MTAPAPLQPDHAEIDRFLNAAFRYADPDTYISFRVFDQVTDGKPPIHIEAARCDEPRANIIAKAARIIIRASNSDRPGVFAPPVATFNNPFKAAQEHIANGLVLSVEIDEGNPDDARRKLEHILGPVTIALHSGSEWMDPTTGELYPKQHLHWRLSEPTRAPEDHAKLKEARWCATMLVQADKTAVPINHPLRWPGSWNLKRAPRMARIAAGNEAAEIHLDDALDKLQDAVERAGIKRMDAQHAPNATPEAAHTLLASAFAVLPNDNLHWDDWNRFGMAAWRASAGAPDGFLAWCEWSAKSAKHDEAACAERWKHYATSPPNKLGAGTIFYAAAQAGWERPRQEPVGMDERPAPPDEVYGEASETPTPTPKRSALEVVVSNLQPRNPAQIPPRPWAYGTFLMFGKVACLGAVDGGGKGSITTTMILAIVTGKPLLGEKVWRSGSVAIISYEDDIDEWDRRISAACLYHKIDPETVFPHIHFLSIPGKKISFASLRDGETVFPHSEIIRQALTDLGVVAWVADPLNHAHDLPDGNNNVMIAQLAGELTRVAADSNTAGMVLHHLRKGSSGSADDLMGATALRATFRATRILAKMSKDEADNLGLDEEWRYIRIAGTKENYAPPPDKTPWFKLESVHLGNATDLYPDGDSIGVARLWTAPSPFDGLSMDDCNAALDIIASGLPDGQLYAPTKRGRSNTRWAGHILINDFGLEEGPAARVIDQWLKNGVLKPEEYTHNGNTLKGVLVDNAKRPGIQHAA